MKNVFIAKELFETFCILDQNQETSEFVKQLQSVHPELNVKTLVLTMILILKGNVKFKMSPELRIILEWTIANLVKRKNICVSAMEQIEKILSYDTTFTENDYLVLSNHLKLIYDFNQIADDVGYDGLLSYRQSKDGFFESYVLDYSE